MMLGARTAAWSGKQLQYLRRVAYLESHGTEYIDLDYDLELKTLDSYRTVCRIAWVKASTGMRQLLGGDSRFFWGAAADEWEVGGNYGISKISEDTFYNADFRISKPQELSFDRKLYVDGSLEVNSSSYSYSDSTFGNFFFAIGSSNHVAKYFCKLKCESINFYVNDFFIRKLIPVLDLSGRPAMYDEVSGQPFYNQGTGEFTWGEIDTSSALVSSRGGTKCLTPRRSYRRPLRPSARFCAHSHRWEVAT